MHGTMTSLIRQQAVRGHTACSTEAGSFQILELYKALANSMCMLATCPVICAGRAC